LPRGRGRGPTQLEQEEEKAGKALFVQKAAASLEMEEAEWEGFVNWDATKNRWALDWKAKVRDLQNKRETATGERVCAHSHNIHKHTHTHTHTHVHTHTHTHTYTCTPIHTHTHTHIYIFCRSVQSGIIS
jgi:hypothetical protein